MNKIKRKWKRKDRWEQMANRDNKQTDDTTRQKRKYETNGIKI